MKTPSVTAIIEFYEDTGKDEVSRQARQELKAFHKLGKRSISLAIEGLKKLAKPIAVDANLFERGDANYPHAENSNKKYKDIQQAIEELEGMNDERRI